MRETLGLKPIFSIVNQPDQPGFCYYAIKILELNRPKPHLVFEGCILQCE